MPILHPIDVARIVYETFEGAENALKWAEAPSERRDFWIQYATAQLGGFPPAGARGGGAEALIEACRPFTEE